MSTHLAAIRKRDAESAETWFRTTAKNPDGVGACGRAFIDRRWLLAELDRAYAELNAANVAPRVGEMSREEATS